jgi:DNA-binding CsgD family transcriptional regulator
MNASSRRQRHFSEHVPEKVQLSKLSGAASLRPLSLAPQSSNDLHSGHRIKAAAPASTPVAARYRLRWGYQELEVPAGTEFSVGRAPECLLRLTSSLVSRHHARFRYGSDGPVIEDLGSLNGVLVNQRKIHMPTLLRHGDTIGIGEEQIKLVDVDVVEASARQSTLRVGPRRQDVSGASAASSLPPSLAALTQRERDVFALMVQGHSAEEMSARLRLSPRTVERHRRRVAERLECDTRAELVTYAICAGLLRNI